MDANRFDTISKLFADRKTRRAAITGGIGLAATAVAGRALAQDGTPVATPALDPNDPHPSADSAKAKTEFLFVQPFDAGTWAPKAGEDGVYTLTLTGAAANTVYFSDRPERVVGITPNQQFLDGLGFTPNNPPNAAVVATREDEDDQEVLVIELLNPAYDAEAQTLTYDARVLADYGEHGLAHLAIQQQDYELGETFGAGSLFIDDCAAQNVRCLDIITEEIYGTLPAKFCYDPTQNTCVPCQPDSTMACGDAFPDQCYHTIVSENGNHIRSIKCQAAVL
jgi:hypothetical protein